MVALAQKFIREANSSKTRTSQNCYGARNPSPTVFLQRKNRGPALNNRILSQKYLDDSTGWYYYGYRYYSPELGRWVNRDPMGEWGGLNLFGYVKNGSINKTDFLGMFFFPRPEPRRCRDLYAQLDSKLEYDKTCEARGRAASLAASFETLFTGSTWEGVGFEVAGIHSDLSLWGGIAFEWSFDFMGSRFIEGAITPTGGGLGTAGIEFITEQAISLTYGDFLAETFSWWPPTGDTICEKDAKRMAQIHTVGIMSANVLDWWDRWIEQVDAVAGCRCLPRYRRKMKKRRARWNSNVTKLGNALSAAKSDVETSCGVTLPPETDGGDDLPVLDPLSISISDICGSGGSCDFLSDL